MKNNNKSQEDLENEFREFMLTLLSAQQYNFIDENDLFSTKTLTEILNRICQIVAEKVGVYSSTVHLQLYDPQKCVKDGKLKAACNEHIENAFKRYGFSESNKSCFIKQRTNTIQSSSAFPYWKYKKGAAELMATSNNDPWKTYLIQNGNNGKKNTTVDLFQGISSDIVQNNIVPIRDRLSIRATRRMKKLGSRDLEVWNHKSWDHIFKNYYGVPIRIHPYGEVIGILKIENKFSFDLIQNLVQWNVEKTSSIKTDDDLLPLRLEEAYKDKDKWSKEKLEQHKISLLGTSKNG